MTFYYNSLLATFPICRNLSLLIPPLPWSPGPSKGAGVAATAPSGATDVGDDTLDDTLDDILAGLPTTAPSGGVQDTQEDKQDIFIDVSGTEQETVYHRWY